MYPSILLSLEVSIRIYSNYALICVNHLLYEFESEACVDICHTLSSSSSLSLCFSLFMNWRKFLPTFYFTAIMSILTKCKSSSTHVLFSSDNFIAGVDDDDATAAAVVAAFAIIVAVAEEDTSFLTSTKLPPTQYHIL